ncbi:tetratricopeptide repeat protein, partial [Escherichia sp. HC-CC]
AVSCQPELALSDLTRSINIAPSANAYVARATIYRQRHNVPAAVSDLRAALELEPNNSNIQAALGYALWDSGDIAQSREMLEQACHPDAGSRRPVVGSVPDRPEA